MEYFGIKPIDEALGVVIDQIPKACIVGGAATGLASFGNAAHIAYQTGFDETAMLTSICLGILGATVGLVGYALETTKDIYYPIDDDTEQTTLDEY